MSADTEGKNVPDTGRITEPGWRRGLVRKVSWLLAAKLVGLLLLWAFFFSPGHRVKVTPEGTGRILAIEPPPSQPLALELADGERLPKRVEKP
jgi:hypothetical protein